MRLLVSRHLENFLAIYAAGNLHVAADRKGISQPALTKSLKLLEADLNTELFYRSVKGLEPTDAGKLLYRYARSIEQEARFAALDIDDIGRRLRGGIRMGFGQAMAMSILPTIIVDFHKQFPGIEMIVETGITNTLIDNLANEQLDLVVVAKPHDPLPDRYVSFPLFKSEMVAVCRKDHPLRSKAKARIEDLGDYERLGNFDDRDFERKFREVPGFPQTSGLVLETTSMSVMLGVIGATDCYTLISAMMLPRAKREGVEKLELDKRFWDLDIELICKPAIARSQPVEAIRQLLIKMAGDRGAQLMR